jgi:hypothetical protein
MSKKLLDNVSMGRTWTSYIGSVEGALKKGNLWNGETYRLMGMTGMAFHFIIHKAACPSSVTVYDWSDDHFSMMDRIGIFSRCTSSMKNFNTYEHIKKNAISEIRQSIDNGIPVVIWAPTSILEFGIIKGYDDDERIFHVMDCMNENPDPLLYENLGKSGVSILFIQRFISKVDVDKETIYRSSLAYGVEQWNKPVDMNSDYASGKKAYINLINTLEKGDYDGFGLSYIFAVYADSKNHICRYLKEINENSKELKIPDKVLDNYNSISDKYKSLCEFIPFKGPGVDDVDKNNIPKIIKLVKECEKLETEAMTGIEKAISV